ncbi:MAG TPA: CBS domain-containing protein [Gemmatimonadaceae bacterium]|nr:CBS domain-containing protein [Gemmatimonadaceae bacterium]
MTLADLLRADRVVVRLQATTVEDAARELVAQLEKSGAVTDAEKLRQRIDEELPEDIVAMGDRAFLLHYRTDATSQLIVALGTAENAICRELSDGDRQCARVLLLVVAPPRLAARYLQVVGAFARFLSSAERVDAVLAQETPQALVQLEELREYELPAQLTVREMMTERPHTTRPDTPVKEAAREMVRWRVSALPVVEVDGRLVGMLSSRDLVRDLLGSYLQGGQAGADRPTPKPPRRTVRDVMTRQVLCVSPDEPLAEVASLMTNKDVERVPVVRDGLLVGFLTRGDIVRKLIGS